MHDLNHDLQPMSKMQAALTINCYNMHGGDGKQYGLVFKPAAPLELKAPEDAITYIESILKSPAAFLRSIVSFFFSEDGKLNEIVVTCKETAKKLLLLGFQMLQFPRAIPA